MCSQVKSHVITTIHGSSDPACSKTQTNRPSCACHVVLFLAEALAAVAVGVLAARSTSCKPPDGFDPALQMSFDDDLLAPSFTETHNSSGRGHVHGRRLVAADFTTEFSRRLLFHKWVEEDVVLDRNGLAQYLRDARLSAGLSSTSHATSRSTPLTLQELTKKFGSAGFPFNPAYAAEAHHMLSAQPHSRGRDEFMTAVRSGLRPHHYYLEVGCGALAAGRHVMRFLLRGRYYCIEEDEYLMRATVEYEVPAAGLIHKRPRFLLDGDVNVGKLLERPTPWVSEAPSLFDYVVLMHAWPSDKMERAVRTLCRYLRPRSGRLILGTALSDRLQQQFGLQPLRDASLGTDAAGMCPFSSRGCAPTHVYHT